MHAYARLGHCKVRRLAPQEFCGLEIVFTVPGAQMPMQTVGEKSIQRNVKGFEAVNLRIGRLPYVSNPWLCSICTEFVLLLESEWGS